MIESGNNERLAPGQTLGGYAIEQYVGRGAFGAVYKARRGGAEPVALKVIEREGNMDRHPVEAEILRWLHHANIVRLLDYFDLEDTTRVVVMEYVEGTTLRGYLDERGRLPVEEVRDLLTQLAGALEHAHDLGVIHRDLKRSNILVDRSGPTPRFVLADFGLARIAEGIQIVRRRGGTRHFMAPEQFRGRAVAQSDLWALGVVAYFALSGKLPFEGVNLSKLTRSVFYDTPLAPSRHGAEGSGELDAIVLRLLEKQLENRTPTAAQLRAELSSVEPVERRTGAMRTPTRDGRTTWEEATQKTIRQSWFMGIVAALLFVGPSALLSGPLTIGVGLMTLHVYRKRGTWLQFAPVLALAALVFVLACVEGTFIVGLEVALNVLAGSVPEVLMVLVGLLLTIKVLGYGFSVHFLVKARRLERGLALVRSMHAGGGSPRAMLKILKQVLEQHPDDVTVHQRYVEALLAAGDPRQAAIEARLVLEADPYNMGATLTLAHAYFELGLYASCKTVCMTYLRVIPYSFELANLRARAERLLTR